MSYTVAKGNQLVDPDQVSPIENAVDLRSDTVTRPSEEMRRAMATAEVGDDVYGEDPTVNRLQQRAAELFAKEAALFVPTGCMGNLTAIKIWTHHGNEVICEERSHVNLYELASMSAIAGCMPRAVRGGDDGIMTWKQVEAAVRPKIYYDSQTALVCLDCVGPAKDTLLPILKVGLRDSENFVKTVSAEILAKRYPENAEELGIYQLYPQFKPEPASEGEKVSSPVK